MAHYVTSWFHGLNKDVKNMKLNNLPELFKVILSGHEEHTEAVETETDAEIVYKRDPEVS